MPKVTQSHRDARRSQILEAAIACFARQGFHRATMHDIVEESRLSAGAIYIYFRSKDEIIAAIADERHARERALIAAARQVADISTALAYLRRAFFGDLDDPRERRRRRVSIQLWAEAQRNPKIRALVRRGIDQPRRLLRQLIAAAQRRNEVPGALDADAAARLMIAAFHGFVLQRDWDEHVALAPYLDVLDFCLQRLLTSPHAVRAGNEPGSPRRGAAIVTASSTAAKQSRRASARGAARAPARARRRRQTYR